ncbi:MAG: hypothetical protein HUJ25_08705 [Crocinitomicaceae bacterium]|nr:hypothetical protein [Crocinitomicaceae bacterium]
MASKKGYNTNLASEFYVLSMLHRLGLDAYMTLGNKKSIDILIESNSKVITIDVKGMAGTTLWPLDNFEKKNKNHFYVLVSFLRKINDPEVAPEIYIVPSTKIEKYFYRNPKGNRQGVQISTMRKAGTIYKGNWNQLIN